MKRFIANEDGVSWMIEVGEGVHSGKLHIADEVDIPDDEWKELETMIATHELEVKNGKVKTKKRDKEKPEKDKPEKT